MINPFQLPDLQNWAALRMAQSGTFPLRNLNGDFHEDDLPLLECNAGS